MPFHPPYEAQSNTIKQVTLFGLLCLALVLLYITLQNSWRIPWHLFRTLMAILFLTLTLANQEIAKDEVMVSFDVVSLFTAIPVDKACVYIRKKLDENTTLHSRTKLNTDELVALLEFTLSNNYFMFNDSLYKQIHGCAMGSTVSPVVANLCMEVIEESAIAASTTPPKVWKRYVCRW